MPNVFLSKCNRLLILIGFLFSTYTATANIILSGAGSLGYKLQEYQSDIEAASGQKIDIHISENISGIQDLLNGNADLAIISGPASAVYKIAKITNIQNLIVHPMGFDHIIFIIHPNNPISELSAQQLKDIFLCKIKNWKEVGGNDAPIKIIVADNTQGFRLAANQALWGDDPLIGAIEYPHSPYIISAVSQTPNAISFIRSYNIVSSIKTITGPAISAPLAIVSNGNPTAAQQAVIDASRTILAKQSAGN